MSDTVQDADTGDATTLDETLIRATEHIDGIPVWAGLSMAGRALWP